MRALATTIVIAVVATGRMMPAQEAGSVDLKDSEALAPPKVDIGANSGEGTGLPSLPEPTANTDNSVPPVPDRKFDELSDAEKKQMASLLGDAARFVQGIRLQEALSKLWEAEQIAPDVFQIHNLRGAAYTKMRDFEKARSSFNTAIALVPDAFHAKFNLTEIDYVTGNYKVAEAEFQKLLDAFPKTDVPTRRLIEYKIMICKLKQGDTEGAEKMLKAYSYLDDTPVYYVANAAIAFHAENREDAESWITSARKIYPAGQMEIFLDALIEAGWIETL